VTAGRDPVIRPEEAVALAEAGGTTFLDVRWALGRTDGHEQYVAGHIPGAAFVDLETDLAAPVGDGSRGRHPLPDPETFAAAMRRAGVRRDRPVVVYDDVAGTSAARAWWLLEHHGHDAVRVLDGGWSHYVAARGPVATGEDHPEEGDFVAGPGRLRVLDADGAARVAREGVLIDARAPERYRAEAEPVDPVAGHIPGAVNVPTAVNLIQIQSSPMYQRFLMLDDLEVRYAQAFERAGVDPSRAQETEVAAYCGSGVTAAHDVLALRRLGVDAALYAALYAGSWSEWVQDPSRPVATDP
jgi:thiosulfate/3-mercaptopyruvate sulfurtransferase